MPTEHAPLLDTIEDGGALLPGGAVALESRAAIGLFVQFAAVGFLFSLLPALNYPLFNVYLQMEGYQTASYAVLVTMGWSFKVVFGVLSDCVPLFGYRRKSWMLLGWFVCLVCFAIMAFLLPMGPPYCNRAKSAYCRTPLAQVPSSELPNFNFHAPDHGGLFILLSMFASLGYVMADCAADALVVTYAQREPLAVRGRTQTTAGLARSLGGLPALLFTAFGLNGVQYNGTYSFSVAPNVPYAVGALPCAIAALAALVWVHEDDLMTSSSVVSIRTWWCTCWSLRQALWQVCAVKYTSGLLRLMAATPQGPIKSLWANVEPSVDAGASLVGMGLYCVGLDLLRRRGLHWDWRVTLVVINVTILVLDPLVILATTWGIIRNQYFFAGISLLEGLPNNMAIVVGNLCVAELSDVGAEGAVSGLLTSMGNLTYPLAAVLYKYIDSFFDVSQDAIKRDTTAVRWDVTAVYGISYACKLAALVPLVWLPRQKLEMQALKREGQTSATMGIAVLVVCGASITFSVVSNCMAIVPATKCFRLAGGNGVVGPDGWCRQ
ncbi:Aste57867_13155 [Aphanomyces stellatus]|uniref:Aste57867_13155 protein n=1 Tax=Aphanomyces stellatus TaxID=120398 RepID=A0A485KZ32_9STRA|nr:hypothetical protein As57867_013106 [Aphanomyces stellatus]VFT89996.1 Aste57867_13155 [Aphanomyces stellatus]